MAGEISIEENKKTICSKPSLQPDSMRAPPDENDPCVQNERLLEKYAQMLGGDQYEEEAEAGEEVLEFEDDAAYQRQLMIENHGQDFDPNDYGEYGFEE